MNETDIDKLIKLCRIACTDEEKKKLLSNLKNVLSYIEQLQAINTEGVPPCNTVLEVDMHAEREDEVGELLSRDLFLSNAPAHVGGMIRVPPVIKFTES